jgi:hypothetical protein
VIPPEGTLQSLNDPSGLFHPGITTSLCSVVIPPEGTLQSLNDPSGLFILSQSLQKTSFLRLFDKIKNPADGGII